MDRKAKEEEMLQEQKASDLKTKQENEKACEIISRNK
jgi:hypothetical protein